MQNNAKNQNSEGDATQTNTAQAILKPTFKEVAELVTIHLDNGLVFNSKRVKAANFRGLRGANYGKRFRMPIMPELVQLVYACLENKKYKTAEEVINSLSNTNILTGNTGILYTKEGMYVQDNPKIDRIISINQKSLENKLGKHEEKGVVFSDDKSVRFTPYNYLTRYQNSLELSRNTGIIALFGGEENAEKIARASEHCKGKSYFLALSDVDSPKIRVAGLTLMYFDFGIDIYADYSGIVADKFSYGVEK
jgi:hypothetical protein